jgi:SAM-dependent methyltransferase
MRARVLARGVLGLCQRRLRGGVRSATALRAFRRIGIGRRLAPVSRQWGFDRGTPVDRYYVEAFLGRFAAFEGYTTGIHGRILEIGGREYADRFVGARAGGDGRTTVDVLHENAANPDASVIGDLTDPATLPAATYDCIICTQVLPVIWDVPSAIRSMHRALKPGGVAFITVPGITKALTPDRDHWGDWWRFTASSARRLVEEVFVDGHVDVETYGNLLSATMFLHGHAAEELAPAELDLRDPEYEVTIAVRAIKGRAADGST